MTIKQFKSVKIIIAMILGAVFAQSIISNNFWIPLVTVSISIIVILILRGRVKEIMADERDYQIAGQAARYTATIFSIVGCTLTFIFMFLKQQNPAYETIGIVIAYTVCLQLLAYSLIFTYLRKFSSK